MEVDFKVKVKLVKNEKAADLSRRQTPLVFSIPAQPKDVLGESITSIWLFVLFLLLIHDSLSLELRRTASVDYRKCTNLKRRELT